MSEWQDIESAPRDGKPFLAYCIERSWGDMAPTYTIQVALWRDNYFASTNGAIPTHWQPLPHPPGDMKAFDDTGFAIVPREPTEAMKLAAEDICGIMSQTQEARRGRSPPVTEGDGM